MAVVGISAATYHPKLYEDVVEHSKNENTRTARSSESTYKTVHQPPFFNFGASKQQDFQKSRYSEQQKMNTGTMVNRMIKGYKYVSQPQNVQYKTVQGNTDDWQPFDPKAPKQNNEMLEVLHHFKPVNDLKFYKPGILKDNLLLKINTPQGGRNILNSTIMGGKDLKAQASDSVEEKIDVDNTQNGYRKIIFVHPNQLHGQLKQSSSEKLRLENTDANIKKPEGQLTVLSDLIGKNPNVQLEGLKRLLQDDPQNNYNFPVIQGPEPFQNRDQTAVTEKKVDIPNIQVNQADNSISLQTPHIINKDSLEDLQKQLDEAAKIQTQQVLARAQQEAQAQVEAQHKAIALAQVQAQKAALEKIQNSIYNSPQALALVQNPQQEEYHDIANNLGTAQPQAPQPLPELIQITNHNIPATSHDHIIHKPEEAGHHPSINELDNDVSIKNLISQSGTKSHIVNIATNSKTPLYENVPAQPYGSKEILYYAPNHHHQAAAQLQAEKAILAQVQAQNAAILHGHKNVPPALQQLVKTEHVASAEAESTSSVTEVKSEPTAYQQFIIESKEVENAGAEQTDYDDFDDVSKAKFKYLNHSCRNVLHILLNKIGKGSKISKNYRVDVKNVEKYVRNNKHLIKKRNTYSVDNPDTFSSTIFNYDNFAPNASRRYPRHINKNKPIRQNYFPKRYLPYQSGNDNNGKIPFYSFSTFDSLNDKLPNKKERPFNVLVVNNNNFVTLLGKHPKKNHGRKRHRKYRKTVIFY